MVTLNATLFVLLAMFLGFLWAMNRFVFAPLLALLDRRNDQIADDKRSAIEAATEASTLEDEYSAKIAHIHREANLRLIRAHRQSQEEHNLQLVAFKTQAEQDIRSLASTLAADVQSQTAEIEQLAQVVQDCLAAKLALE